MGSITTLTSEWRDWIVTNIARDVPLPSLIEQMVKNDFDLVFATNTVVQLAQDKTGLSVEQLAANSAVAVQPQFKFPIPAGYEAHYANYQYEGSHIAAGNSLSIGEHVVRVAGRVGRPDIAILENVLTPEECDELIALSQPKLQRSRIVDHKTGAEEVMDLRSSYGTYFLRGENTLVQRLEKRLAQLIGMPVDHGEGLQILHYSVGAEYQPHYDFFLPESSGSAIHVQKGGQRVITVIMYLNDVEAGGETIFPELDFSVAPRKGSAVYFSYCNSQNKLDRMTLHGGAPVERGEKWIATLWVRQGVYQ
jgi:prolyl 4-hydroxylase